MHRLASSCLWRNETQNTDSILYCVYICSCMCHRSYAVVGPFHRPFVLSVAWWFSIFSVVFLVLVFRIFRNRCFRIWTFLKCIGWKLFHLNWNYGWWIFCKVLFAKSYFVKQLWYKLFRSDRSCETLFLLHCASDKWHFYEIMDSFESAFA